MRGHKCTGKILLLIAKEGDNLGRKIPADPAYYLEGMVNSEGVGNVSTEDKGEDEPRGSRLPGLAQGFRDGCDECKIFGHVHDHCPKKMVSPPIVTTSNIVAPTVEKSNNGFQMVGKKKKRKGKSKTTNGDCGSPKNDNFTTSNYFSTLNDEEVENVYDESANLVPNTNTGGSSSFTAAAS
ncbi:hypothetical protein Tco_1013149 [Tanacetum coccineum]